MRRASRFFSSMAGRLFAILLCGVALTALLATTLANWHREYQFERLNVTHAAERVADFVAMIERSEEPLRESVMRLGGQGLGIRHARGDNAQRAASPERPSTADPEFDAAARAQGLTLTEPSRRMSPVDCLPGRMRSQFDRMERQRADVGLDALSDARTDPALSPPVCRWIDLTLANGSTLNLSVSTPPVLREPAHALAPWMLALLGIAMAVLSYLVAHMAAAPLLRLAKAATALGRDLDRAPIEESGPEEVARAAAAFNLMQNRLQSTLRERTHMLAAITHDLQTPLTRLRLRLEKVQDTALRERLVTDLAAMQDLIREGLDIARSTDAAEDRVLLDLDSLLGSLVEDAVDAGADARFDHHCQCVIPLRPLAMRRVFSNLIDNALKYGASAVVNAQREGAGLVVTVTNPGPPLPEDRIAALFEPFVRLETSRSRDTGGLGLGLTIARTLAARDGAELQLRNTPQGIEASVRWAELPD